MNSNIKLLLNLIIIYSVLFIGCGQIASNESKIMKQLIGKWKSNPESILSIEFKNEGEYNLYYNGHLETEINFNDNTYHQLYYELVKEKDYDRLLIYGKNPKEILFNYKVEIHEGKLYLVSFKSLPGITHHIDEYSSYSNVKEFESKENQNELTTKIIFPNDHKGLSLIAFGEESGKPRLTDSKNLDILRIPSNGMLVTQSKPNPFALMRNEVTFFRENKSGKLEEIELITYNRNTGYDNKRSLDSAKLYVINYGFNQIDRPRVNSKLFKSEVSNDVLFLGVGSPAELNEIWSLTIESIQ